MSLKGKLLTGALVGILALSGSGGNNQEVFTKPAPIVVEEPPELKILHEGSVTEMQLSESLVINKRIYQGPNLFAIYDGNDLVEFCDGRYTATGLNSGAQFLRLVIGYLDSKGNGYSDTYLLDPDSCGYVQHFITNVYDKSSLYPEARDDKKHVSVKYAVIGDNEIVMGVSIINDLVAE